MIAFASIDPHKGKMGAREARRLVEQLRSIVSRKGFPPGPGWRSPTCHHRKGTAARSAAQTQARTPSFEAGLQRG